MFCIPNVSRFLTIIKMRSTLIFAGLIFLASTVQTMALYSLVQPKAGSRIIKIEILLASKVSRGRQSWKERLLSYISFAIEQALIKKMDKNLTIHRSARNPAKNAVLPVLPMTATLTQPINDDPDKQQTRRNNNISNRWIRLWCLTKN